MDRSFPGGTMVKNPPANTGDTREAALIPGSIRSPGEGNGNPLQYSCLENPMDRGAWRAIVRGVPKSQTGLSMQARTEFMILGGPGLSHLQGGLWVLGLRLGHGSESMKS